jgi:hypothetical protein
MTPTDFLLTVPFLLLAIAALPLSRLRRALLYLLHRGGHVALLGAFTTCGLFAFQPDLAPDALRDLLTFAAPDGYPEVAWVVKAALLFVLALHPWHILITPASWLPMPLFFSCRPNLACVQMYASPDPLFEEESVMDLSLR